jgi:hypothetical protein
MTSIEARPHFLSTKHRLFGYGLLITGGVLLGGCSSPTQEAQGGYIERIQPDAKVLTVLDGLVNKCSQEGFFSPAVAGVIESMQEEIFPRIKSGDIQIFNYPDIFPSRTVFPDDGPIQIQTHVTLDADTLQKIWHESKHVWDHIKNPNREMTTDAYYRTEPEANFVGNLMLRCAQIHGYAPDPVEQKRLFDAFGYDEFTIVTLMNERGIGFNGHLYDALFYNKIVYQQRIREESKRQALAQMRETLTPSNGATPDATDQPNADLENLIKVRKLYERYFIEAWKQMTSEEFLILKDLQEKNPEAFSEAFIQSVYTTLDDAKNNK